GGALYDTVVDPEALLSYRAASLATIFAAYVLSLHLVRTGSGGLSYRPLGRPGLLFTGALAGAGSALAVVWGPSLGHWQSSGTIAAALGGRLRAGRCEVVYATGIARDRVVRFARDCDGHALGAARWFGASDTAPLTAYLFASDAQKRQLTGASRTSIAKPWRREIYLTAGAYPHPVLGHEVAHVVAGDWARGPLRVGGALGGWLPDPGLIEGVAVAAAPPEGDLRAAEWAKAMKDIGVLPPLRDLFALAFLGKHSATAYTAAGAFVGHVHERFGAEAIRRWYGGEPLPRITGRSWSALESGWHAALDTLPLTDAAREQARAHFDRPGVLGRRCPHRVDRAVERAGALFGAGDAVAARQAYREALGFDAGHEGALLGEARCVEQSAGAAAGEGRLRALGEDARLPLGVREAALERLGDLALRRGEADVAARRYRLARARAVDEDRLRTLDVKEHYAAQPVARAALVALLVGRAEAAGPDQAEALDRIGRWRALVPGDGMPDYLLGRQHAGNESWALAAERLDEALAKPPALPRVVAEAWRLRLLVACAQDDAAGARRAYEQYRRQPTASAARVEAARQLLERCTWPAGAPR
ncbi:MAG: hypothetical protein HY744_20385, partial [Deltaproteobacteria bacterium]|nr:hypothetical protein [Deltaproteobacteria bacterium]